MNWFSDSPDAGLPGCICSWCGAMITENVVPVRVFDVERNLEARFHPRCYAEVIAIEELSMSRISDQLDDWTIEDSPRR